ncbi:YfcE family phosphodiesterase [Lacticaseibacillus sp. GG6-2]
MYLVAVSDTHGDAEILKAIAERHQDAAAFFYAGDSELTADDPLFQIYQPVAGNMDFDPAFPLTVTRELPGLKVFMTHGHRYNVNFSLDHLLAAGEEAQADLVIFGHTHQLGVEKHTNTVLLNPGSISQPRGEFAHLRGTYATVVWDAETIKVSYRTRDGQVVKTLEREFQR